MKGPASKAFFDELRKIGFLEGRNLIVDRKPSDLEFIQTLATTGSGHGHATRTSSSPWAPSPCLRPSSRRAKPFQSCSSPTTTIRWRADTCKVWQNPGRNITGVFLRQTELAEKQVELLTRPSGPKRLAGTVGREFPPTSSKRRSDVLDCRAWKSSRARWKIPPTMSGEPSETSPTPRRKCCCYCPVRTLP